MAFPIGSLADIEAWWAVLRDALRMAPHRAAHPGAGDAALKAYAPKVIALIAAAEWLTERFRTVLRTNVAEPLEHLFAQSRSLGIESPAGLRLLEGLLSRPQAPEGLTPVVQPWVLFQLVEAAAIGGVVVLAARLLRPHLPLRPALALALTALASANLYNLLVGALILRIEDALGMLHAMRAAAAAQGDPLPQLLLALGASLRFGMIASAAGILPMLALVVTAARGFRAAGHPRPVAVAIGIMALAGSTAASLVSHTILGAALLRVISF